jgi:hypothetical protein
MRSPKAVRRERGRLYGDHVRGHGNLGLMWTGLLQNHYGIVLPHPIPAHLAEAMMVCNKLNRIAVSPQHEDNYTDAVAYVQMAEEAYERESDGATDCSRRNPPVRKAGRRKSRVRRRSS